MLEMAAPKEGNNLAYNKPYFAVRLAVSYCNYGIRIYEYTLYRIGWSEIKRIEIHTVVLIYSPNTQ